MQTDRSQPTWFQPEAAFLAANGVRTVFVTGSTGECHSLTCAGTAGSLCEAWAHVPDRPRASPSSPFATSGGNSLDEARILARQATRALGLSAVSSMAPSCFKPVHRADLADWCAAIAAETPELPFYYYDIPSMTGVSLSMERFLSDAGAHIPNLAGIAVRRRPLISQSLPPLPRCGWGRFDLPWGVDEALLGAIATGARLAGVGSTLQLGPALYHGSLIAAFDRGDLERSPPAAVHFDRHGRRRIAGTSFTWALPRR
jgi:N-acetylneuraminate lyase